MDLTQLRKDIDEIDRQLVELYEQRMDICTRVAEYKIENHKPVFDKLRETEKLQKVCGLARKEENRKGVEELFTQLMSLSRKLQYGILLEHEKNLLKVYLYAPYEVRLKNCVERLGMTEKEAVKTISAVDKARESYHKRYIPGYQNATLDSDLCINTGSYTVEQVATLIQDAAKNKFGFDVVQG